MEHGTTWFGHFLHLDPRLDHIITAIFVLLLLVIAASLGARAIKKSAGDPLPEGGFSLRNVLELAVESLYNMVSGVMGEKKARYFTPLIGTVFLYIFANNLIGVVPGFLPPTQNVNTNISMALVIFVLTHFYGIREHGAGYVKHFLGPVLLLAPLMLAVELVSHIVRPLSLTIRLYGNINGDHIVLNIFSNIWSLFGVNFPEVGIPVVFLALGIFISFIQAFVFSLLSMVYIAGAMAHDH
jgi:F-type H+-transporting ATPase subunit a